MVAIQQLTNPNILHCGKHQGKHYVNKNTNVCTETLSTSARYTYSHVVSVTGSSTFCPLVWDDLFCWDVTRAGTVARKSCPDYINGFNKNGKFVTYKEATLCLVVWLL